MKRRPSAKPFSLPPHREAALWQSVASMDLDPHASALTIVRAVLARRSDPTLDPEAFGAAAEIAYHAQRGRPVMFAARPAGTCWTKGGSPSGKHSAAA